MPCKYAHSGVKQVFCLSYAAMRILWNFFYVGYWNCKHNYSAVFQYLVSMYISCLFFNGIFILMSCSCNGKIMIGFVIVNYVLMILDCS